MRVLVAGSGGLVGHEVTKLCDAHGDQVFAYDHQRLDISDSTVVVSTINELRPEVVINCAAWTDVDGCELDHEKAIAANASGPENLAKACRDIGAGLVTISTDYVFDGTKDGFYSQRDDPNPISIYGLSKLQGERRAQAALARTIVVRTGFVFGSGGKNFLSTIIERCQKGDALKAIEDAWGTPTYARDLATRLRELAILDLPGIYHVVNAGEGATYEQFARVALEAAGCDHSKLETVKMESLRRPAPRPINSRLKCLISPAIGLNPLPEWQEALADFAAKQLQTNDATLR